MCKSKSVLLIGGGGMLGNYTAHELLRLGHSVDIIEVADIYTELIGARFRWVDMETYIKSGAMHSPGIWALKYDRVYDRKINNSKVLNATKLEKEDFTSIREGIKIELAKVLCVGNIEKGERENESSIN